MPPNENSISGAGGVKNKKAVIPEVEEYVSDDHSHTVS